MLTFRRLSTFVAPSSVARQDRLKALATGAVSGAVGGEGQRRNSIAGNSRVGNASIASLAMAPRYVKAHEQGAVNRFATDLTAGKMPRDANGKIPLSKVLDPGLRYLFVLEPPPADKPDAKPKVRLGFEHRDESGNAFGHPTLFGENEEKSGLIGGELYNRDGKWIMDNNSGRWGSGSTEELSAADVHKRDLLKMAADAVNDKTDLDVTSAIQFSEHRVKRVFQQAMPRIAKFDIDEKRDS